ncbi:MULTISPECIES: AtpZ/AtpI family protein [Bartonella]|uniref:ATP synthase protein I n=1 Tax=Bartonella choladocola TaxID=2750995 RepID=A0A1U9MGN1_9HYPH|nr:AtpZ/AtpI family protein [Bartonella choladocola]AQT46791.1 ATP synthase protein I [Bartonella choladocola]MBI0140151.1 AtpZ/AtpI family protein [Bartonella choladocola]
MAKDAKPVKPEKGTQMPEQGNSPETLDLETRRRNLQEKLARYQRDKKPDPSEQESGPPKGMAQAIRLSSEFLAGVVVGVILGLGFDQLAGTSPWGLIIFLFLGFSAGVLNILRSVGAVAPSQIGKNGASRQDDGPNKPK